MLSKTKLSLLQELVQSASKEEIIWTKGYLSGYLDKNGIDVEISDITETKAVTFKPLIVYGTETGNSKKIASLLLAGFKKNKIQSKIVDVFQYDFAKLEKESLVLFVMSTQGEGEFPQNAVDFYEKLKTSDVDLSKVSYAIFALGDSSYPLFCNAGILLDTILTEKGAKSLLPLVKADVDFTESVLNWEKKLLNIFLSYEQVSKPLSTEIITEKISNKKTYTGSISHKVILNDRESSKETYHIEITSDVEVSYEPGDALGIISKNTNEDVDFILNYFQVEATQEIEIINKKKTLKEWLEERNIRGLSKRSLDQIALLFDTTIHLEKADLIDILKEFPKQKSKDIVALVKILLPIAPRLYSISSSAEAHDGEVHLTVSLNKFITGNEVKFGFASQFLANYPLNKKLEFYIHKNKNFRLPTESTDLIMIGPGTGIAPFRSFLAHRDATGAIGKNWLFFGEQHFVSDFYYQTEIQEWIASGVLSKLSTAFSRDQDLKIYVQDRIRDNALDFNKWLKNGASIYVCGQKNTMSLDVEQAIIEVIAQERKLSLVEAKQVLDELENQGKYQKDVY